MLKLHVRKLFNKYQFFWIKMSNFVTIISIVTHIVKPSYFKIKLFEVINIVNIFLQIKSNLKKFS
jgi:hypothetical protein